MTNIPCDYLGQLMVALFLFYSGYGIYEAIKRKGYEYVGVTNPVDAIEKLKTEN